MINSLEHIPVVLLDNESCGYFDDRKASNLLVHPDTELSLDLQEQLGAAGFRRNGQYFYRPHCQNCERCVSLRVPVQQFKPSRTQRKLLNRNRHVLTQIRQPEFLEEHYALYYRYLEQRHADGDMFPPSRQSYHSFLIQHAGSTQLVELRDQHSNQLLAVAVTDFLANSLSAVYTFFDPDLAHLSLGSLSELKQIELAQQQQKPYVYLGFWIAEHPKMDYKTGYAPFELYFNEQWHAFAPK